MPVKIRLQRKGRKKAPFYHVVIADARAPRDGKFIENIGVYDPMTKPATIDIDRDKAYDWLMKGAQPTDTVNAILRFKGVLYRKHLMGGVAKGALTEEQANEKYNAWIAAKEEKIKARFEQTSSEKKAFMAAVSGTVPKIVIKEDPVAEEAAPESAEATEAPEAVAPEAAEEAVAVAEETVEAVAEAKEEAPAAAEEAVAEEAKEAGEEVAKPTEE